MKKRDYKHLFRRYKLTLKNISYIKEDYYEVRFKVPKNLIWKPGEHAVFQLPYRTGLFRKSRTFSIASTPQENEILIGTRTGSNESDFKRRLLNLAPGDQVFMRGPFGFFTLKDSYTPVVFIALGIGINPIRSLLTWLQDAPPRKVHIIYNSNQVYMYKKHIKSIVSENELFHISFTKTIEETIDHICTLIEEYNNDAFYYVSGGKLSIQSVRQLLEKQGINKKRMIFETITGYEGTRK